jgi:hypothetical protein
VRSKSRGPSNDQLRVPVVLEHARKSPNQLQHALFAIEAPYKEGRCALAHLLVRMKHLLLHTIETTRVLAAMIADFSAKVSRKYPLHTAPSSSSDANSSSIAAVQCPK